MIYSNYAKFLLVGDFKAETTYPYISSFLYQDELSSIVKESTCFKNNSNPKCIDLFLDNSALSFQHILTVSSGLSNFHKLVMTVLKSTFSKNKPREIVYTLKFRIDGTPRLFRFLPPSLTLLSTPRLLILENFASLPFYPMCSIDSGNAKPRLFDAHVFFNKHDFYKRVQAQVWE